MTLLKAENISLSFEQLKIFKNISFQVKKGQFLAIVGPLGCGKTTLLKTLGGLIPTQGKVYFNGRLLKKPSAKIGFVFQKSDLFPWLTVSNNISLPLKISQKPEKEIKQKTDQMLKLIDLERFKNVYPAQLSGGMKQLTSLARAFISEAEILLLDEPFTSLDAINREKMNQKLLALWQKKKKTVILITHKIEEAVFLADQVLIMSKRPGRIKKIKEINLPRPRSLSMLDHPKFHALVKEVRSFLI